MSRWQHHELRFDISLPSAYSVQVLIQPQLTTAAMATLREGLAFIGASAAAAAVCVLGAPARAVAFAAASHAKTSSAGGGHSSAAQRHSGCSCGAECAAAALASRAAAASAATAVAATSQSGNAVPLPDGPGSGAVMRASNASWSADFSVVTPEDMAYAAEAAALLQRTPRPIHSNFLVAAVVTYADTRGELAHVCGVNSETAVISASICAERSAFVQLRLQSNWPHERGTVRACYITTTSEDPISPGLLCREFMQELGAADGSMRIFLFSHTWKPHVGPTGK